MSEPVKRGRGRPTHQPTDRDREIVTELAGFGIPRDRIAKVIRIAEPTLLKHYGAELEEGSALVEAKLVGNLVRLAGGDDHTALKATMFALQARFGWTAYAPAPAAAKAPPRGKKEIAQDAALSAERDTEWADLVH